MPGKRATDKRASWEVDFVRCELHKAHKEALQKFDLKGEATFDIISRLVDDGFKLSIAQDKAHNCVGAYITSPKRDNGARQRCLGARGPDLFGSLRALAFKHSVVLGSDWGNAQSEDWGDDAWG